MAKRVEYFREMVMSINYNKTHKSILKHSQIFVACVNKKEEEQAEQNKHRCTGFIKASGIIHIISTQGDIAWIIFQKYQT